jgi:hypothetical protein
VRGDRAVQLSGDGATLVPAVPPSRAANTFILKPSEQVPLSQQRIFELLEKCDLPPGVVNLVHGGREVAEAICDHKGIRAVSFVGSDAGGAAVYQRASHTGKRVQALGGAKNFIVVMPDADLRARDSEHIGVVLRMCGRAVPRRQRIADVGDAHLRRGTGSWLPRMRCAWRNGLDAGIEWVRSSGAHRHAS